MDDRPRCPKCVTFTMEIRPDTITSRNQVFQCVNCGHEELVSITHYKAKEPTKTVTKVYPKIGPGRQLPKEYIALQRQDGKQRIKDILMEERVLSGVKSEFYTNFTFNLFPRHKKFKSHRPPWAKNKEIVFDIAQRIEKILNNFVEKGDVTKREFEKLPGYKWVEYKWSPRPPKRRVGTTSINHKTSSPPKRELSVGKIESGSTPIKENKILDGY